MATGKGARTGGKVVGVLGATAAGLALLLSYRSHASVATTSPASSSVTVPTGRERVAIGAVAVSPNGPVRVEVWEHGTTITDVEALSLPNDNAHSIELSNYSGPRLRKEALKAQSAKIDGVSGATMTSTAYQQSLQSALDRIRDEGRTVVVGPRVETEYGPVQVELELSSGHLTAVQSRELPADDALAASLSNYAAPILAREALRAKSAKIDGVSGATMTATAYRTSLQRALEEWKNGS